MSVVPPAHTARMGLAGGGRFGCPRFVLRGDRATQKCDPNTRKSPGQGRPSSAVDALLLPGPCSWFKAINFGGLFEINRKRHGGFLVLLQTPAWEFVTAVEAPDDRTVVGPIQERSLPMPPVGGP